ncbi:MAG: WXG100 family type VII secretion target [Chloroflexi bacterium]|nr:WXG100 family type VII secretion target [Chloroflexota bacterium]
MSTVISDPTEIRRFQAALRQFNSEMSSSTSRVRAQLNSLSTTWRDQEYARFSQELEVVMQGFERYLQSADDYIRYLDAKAGPLEQYLGR